MDEIITQLAQPQLGLTAKEIADIIWMMTLAHSWVDSRSGRPSETPKSRHTARENPGTTSLPTAPKSKPSIERLASPQNPSVENSPEKQAGLYPRRRELADQLADSHEASLPFWVPNAPSLREDPLAMGRALRPLIRKVPSEHDPFLDEQATAQAIAESNAKIWLPITKPRLEPCWDLALVVDESHSMLIWQQTIIELRRILRRDGAFRDVRTWGLVKTNESTQANKSAQATGAIGVRPVFWAKEEPHLLPRRPEELIDPSRRRLILVVTDCVSEIWRTGAILEAMKVWAKSNPLAIVQMLPEWLWERTTLQQATPAYFYGLEPGVSNYQMQRVAVRRSLWDDSEQFSSGIPVPILTTKPERIAEWSKMVTGRGSATQALGVVFHPGSYSEQPDSAAKPERNLTVAERIQQFRLDASPMAWHLARLLAAAPVISLPVIRLIQATLLQKSSQEHVAEVLLGGILKPKEPPELHTHPDDVVYRFIDPEIPPLLCDETSTTDMVKVLSKYIRSKLNKSLDEFLADLRIVDDSSDPLEEAKLTETLKPFAIVAADVLKRKGGRYAKFVEQLEAYYNLPTRMVQFEYATLRVNSGLFGSRLDIAKHPRQTRLFREKIVCDNAGNPVSLDMVQIPSGRFRIGSSADEVDHEPSEELRQQVTISEFWMGQFPITQAQWRAVATLPQVKIALSLDHQCRFQGDRRPVEQVSWEEAVEFCDRLSQQTKRTYRLPSESEWEYACRAIQPGEESNDKVDSLYTPFHYGKTIIPELANYDGNYIYEGKVRGIKGEWLEQTTDVGTFPANAFGLYDMHGNVAEWCADHWHPDHTQTPKDGSAWQDSNLPENSDRVVRGGSWVLPPRYSCSAYRSPQKPNDRRNDIGFRVVLEYQYRVGTR